MPIRYIMSWQQDKLRWRKMFKGKWYFVTPKDLGCLPTKEASWAKANQWWESQMTAISNRTSLSSLLTEALQEMVGSKPPLQRIGSLVKKGEAARKRAARGKSKIIADECRLKTTNRGSKVEHQHQL